MKTIFTENAPVPVGPYAQAIITESKNLIFCSGQLGIVRGQSALISSNVEKQAVQIFRNIEEVVKAAGCSAKNIVKVNIFLTDLNDFVAVNKIFSLFFENHKPARSTVEVSRLPMDAKIEIECIAEGQ
ncbi:RidA family protein [Croceitalea sp. MTPC9]|uniref:Rid family detoxifying hydrolase n=1 Tax=unclassified Croceitalea TaxID=2632280 RepID=UPI002B3DE4E6|nr:RidA family protein [Croceitalea sp. MTPC6]GMN16140.1 RidA family protein [Croceitalea sp. MTPC9]